MSNLFEANGTDEDYCDLKNEINCRCREAKKLVEELFEKVCPYLDPDILDDLPKQFHPRFWEIYLAHFLIEAGLHLEPSSSRDGPDIHINFNQSSVWVEAVTVSSGSGADAVPKIEPDGVVGNVPDEKIKLRLIHAFTEKSAKYKRYLEKNWIGVQDPYIIAINAAQVSRVEFNNPDIPRIIKSLLPFGAPGFRLNEKTQKLVHSSYEYQEKVTKRSGTDIETTSFLNLDYSGISAVIYSHVDVVNLDRITRLVHNPLALNPVPLGFLQQGIEYWAEMDLNKLVLKHKEWSQ